MSIIQNPIQPSVCGGIISPAFGQQFSGPQAVGAPLVNPVPLGGVQKSLLEACSKGELPRNAQLASVSGQAVSAGISASQGDGMSVDEGMTSGNGNQLNLGVAVAPNAGNTSAVSTAGISQQVFVGGEANANAAISNGPAATNIESAISAPMPGSITVGNIALLAGVYQG